MSDRDDPAQLAKQYLDLWQQQAASFSSNPDIAAAMAKLFEGLTPTHLSKDGKAEPSGGKNSEREKGTRGDDGTAAENDPGNLDQDRATPPAAASDDGGDRLDELLRGLARLEERLDVIERKLDK